MMLFTDVGISNVAYFTLTASIAYDLMIYKLILGLFILYLNCYTFFTL